MIEIHDIHDEPVTVLNPDGTELVTTDSKLVFIDILLQIKQQRLEGYKINFKGEIRDITPNGKIIPYPEGLMDKGLEILRKLVLHEN